MEGNRVAPLIGQQRRTSLAGSRAHVPNAPIAVASSPLSDTGIHGYPIALGGSIFGWTVGVEGSVNILDAFREHGGSLLDTADSYSAGRSEIILGNWMRSRGVRDEMVVTTKIGRNLDNPGLSPRSIIGAVEDSLERLRTDYIDLLYFHLDDTSVPLEESLGAVDILIRSGKVRHIGASDFSGDRLIEARVLAANGLPRFSALATHYNLLHRQPYESSLELVCGAQHIAVMPYFALAHGFLAGRYATKREAEGSTRADRAARYFGRGGQRVLGVVQRIATDYGVEPATVALAWLRARPGVYAPIVGASDPVQIPALMAAGSMRLEPATLAALDRATR